MRRFWVSVLALLAACPSGREPHLELEASSGAGDSTGASGLSCAGDDVAVLDRCARAIMVPQIEWAESAAAGDFDGDGAVDLALVCRGAVEFRGLCVWSLDGTVTRLDLEWLRTYPEVHAADFDGDGRPDILVSELFRFAVYSLHNGALTLRSELSFDQEIHDPADAAVFPTRPIDVDGDGRAEVAAGGLFTGVRLWRMDAQAGAWVPSGPRHELSGCGEMKDARVTDLDADGAPELIAFGSHNDCDEGPLAPGGAWNRVHIFTSDAANHTLVLDSTLAAELPAWYVDVGDLNGDDQPDLIVADEGDGMMMFPGNGDRSFGDVLPLLGYAGFSGTGPVVADFDADGIDELLVEQNDHSYRILVGLLPPRSFEVPLPSPFPWVLLAPDLDQDGRADIVANVGDHGDYHLAVILSGE